MQPWDQQENETSTAYTAFLIYRDLGAVRTVPAAYRKFTNNDKAEVARRWKLWSAKHKWINRTRAWDNHTRGVADAARDQVIAQDSAERTREEIRKQRRQQQEEDEWATRDLLLKKAKETLNAGTTIIGAKVAVSMIKLVMELGRASSQMPRTIASNDNDGHDDELFETTGQLVGELKPGVVPAMPKDTFAKPDLSSAVAEVGQSKPPDKRNRVRPV